MIGEGQAALDVLLDDDLVALTDDPVRQDPAAVLGRAVAVGHVLGAAAGLRETDRLREVLGDRHRWHAVRGHLHELDGDFQAAATAYAAAARRATDVAERDHLVRQAARARAGGLPARLAVVGVDRRGRRSLVGDPDRDVRVRPCPLNLADVEKRVACIPPGAGHGRSPAGTGP